ncbi:hypothetical protein EDD15DRAFT_2521942 [Pisolithus albus]|nr:hypothetical protein EDD15DRAFT_2521942 [Pisolithus albus]
MAGPASGRLRDGFGNNSGSDDPIGTIPFTPCHPRSPLPSPTVSRRTAQRLLLGSFLFPPILLPCELSAPYLPKFFSGPLAFLGHYTIRSWLSNGVTLVAIGPAVVEKFEFRQREVSPGSFACILGLDFRVDCISSYHSAAFPSPIPFISTPDLSLFALVEILPAATRPQTRQSRRAQTQVPSSSEQAQQQPAAARPPPATFEEALARCPPVPAPAQQGTNATAAHMPNRQGDSANQPVTPVPPATTPVPAVPTAGEGVEGPPPPTPAAYEAIIAALYEQLNNLRTHAQPQPDRMRVSLTKYGQQHQPQKRRVNV